MTLFTLLASVETIEYTPDVTDVGTLLRARTKDTGGNELGTFTGATRPTGTQVQAEIAHAVDEVWGTLGHAPVVTPLDEATLQRFFPRVKRITAIYAAMLVELSYFPEQIQDDQSPYDRLKELYDAGLQGLKDSVTTDPGDRQGIASVGVSSPTSTEFDRLGATGRVSYLPDERWPAY